MSEFEQTAKADRIKSEARDICYQCEQTLWLSFYFDAFSHHKDNDGETISNIGKLWTASFESENKGIRRFYYPGLGATFNPELAVLAAMEATKAAEEIKKAETGIAKASAIKTGTAVYGEVEEAVIKGRLGWWERIEKIVKKEKKRVYEKYKDQYDFVVNEKERGRHLRRFGRYWTHFAEDLLYHPMRCFNIVRNEVAKITAGHAVERFSFARDATWIAALFNTGVDTRLEAAEHDFKTEVAAAKRIGTIKHINVAVFGADMGGALAIAFANKLFKDVCKKGKYEGAEVRLRFIGLFDVVASRYDDNFLTGFIPLANSVTSDLKIPKVAERVVHFAAAHENRLYKPLSSISGVNEPGVRLEEKLFPGAQQDVTGGYAKGEQHIDNQLARMPLRMMLGRAWRYGVPLYSLSQLDGGKEIETINFYKLFQIDSKLSDQVYAYWNKVKELSAQVVPISDAVKFDVLAHPDKVSATSCYVARLPEPLKTVPGDITSLLPAHMALFIAWLKLEVENHKPGPADSKGRKQQFQLLADEVSRMKERSKINPLDPAALSKQEKEIWNIWQSSNAATLGDLAGLFSRNVHDSMQESMIEKVWGDFFYAHHYLNYRQISTLEIEPDQTFFNRLIFGEQKKKEFGDKKATS